MIRHRKIRGGNRILKSIEEWKNYNIELDLDYLKSSKRNYCKIWVSPFTNISITGSNIPSPKHKHRQEIIKGLLDIYNHWEQQLNTLNKPYYLAIWLFEPRLKKSQVVCAIDEMVNFYDITFYKPKDQHNFPSQNYGKLQEELNTFNWAYALDEDHFFQSDIDLEEDSYANKQDYIGMQKWYNRKLKQGLRTDTSSKDTFCAIKMGTTWIGTKN
ncbi:hypothetical protein AB9K24_01350 [Meridianimaribacter flavus]